MNLLLDTCTFIWLTMPGGKLSTTATLHLNNRASNLFISDVSLWEISMKYSARKLPLPEPPRQWLPQQLAFFQIQTLPLNHDAIFRSGELPRVHPDPFDRLLAAKAIETGMTIISPDTPLSLLGASRIW
jgi:PIN domain nuclease of toxin-antitoxin system